MDPNAVNALVIGVAVATGVSTVPGIGSVLAVTRFRSPRLGIIIQIPVLTVGLVLVGTSLTLLLTGRSPAVGLGLLGGGGTAAMDACLFLFVVKWIWGRRQAFLPDARDNER
jgi:hypothetical protein